MKNTHDEIELCAQIIENILQSTIAQCINDLKS